MGTWSTLGLCNFVGVSRNVTDVRPPDGSSAPHPALRCRSRALLALCGIVLALTILTLAPAQAFERRTYGGVTVEPDARVDEAVAIVGGVKVSGTVKGGVYSGYGSILIDGPVGGDVSSGFGDVSIRAPVGGDVNVGFGEVYLDSPVAGDVDVRRGDLRLGPNAEVDGHVSVGSGSVQAQSVAALPRHLDTGTTAQLRHAPDRAESPAMFGWLLATLALVACTILATVALPHPVHAAALRLGRYPARSLLFGVISLPLAVSFTAALAVSVVGVPLLLLLAPAYLALLFFGALVTSYFIGRRVLMFADLYRDGDVPAAAIGVIIVATVYLIPVVGELVPYLVSLLGTGATIIALSAYYRSFRRSA